MNGRFSRFVAAFVALAAGSAAAELAVWPDYLNVALPVNIAPLNFKIAGKPPYAATCTAANGDLLVAVVRTDGVVQWPRESWRNFLSAHLGEDVEMLVSADEGVCVATNHIAGAIDSHLTYRLIEPSYESFHRMGVHQRDLTSFAERSLFQNRQLGRRTCVNCHTYRQGDPGTYLFHLRQDDVGTVIVSPRWGRRKVDIAHPGLPARGTYPAWHPRNGFIVFSCNETRQMFYFDAPDNVEVVDFQSRLALYDIRQNRLVPLDGPNTDFETYPTWSPDGRQLYSARAHVPLKELPTDYEARAKAVKAVAKELHYDLVVRSFDETTARFSAPRLLIDAVASKLSVSFPRVSPDGRWLVLTIGPYGNFHVWHNQADLWLLDLEKGTLRPLTELNSPAAESYHGFSKNGRWLVFSSRREDGAYTRPYFAHFDPKTGRFAKPFLLPTEDPGEHFERLLSYNVPELSAGPVTESPAELRKLAEQPVMSVKEP